MFVAGTIIYFTPFYFKNGAASKAKYFIVLKEVDDHFILASLPSSKIHLPHRIPGNHGCIEVPEGSINCFLFEAGRSICTNEFAFPRLTAVYGQQIDNYEKVKIKENYPMEGVDYEIMGQLKPVDLEELLNCLRNSAVVKRKYKKIL